MKPTPASSMQRRTPSGPMSTATPSASSTSAEPHSEDTAGGRGRQCAVGAAQLLHEPPCTGSRRSKLSAKWQPCYFAATCTCTLFPLSAPSRPAPLTGAVAVLGNLGARGGRNDGGSRRNVDRTDAVAAGSHNVQHCSRGRSTGNLFRQARGTDVRSSGGGGRCHAPCSPWLADAWQTPLNPASPAQTGRTSVQAMHASGAVAVGIRGSRAPTVIRGFHGDSERTHRPCHACHLLRCLSLGPQQHKERANLSRVCASHQCLHKVGVVSRPGCEPQSITCTTCSRRAAPEPLQQRVGNSPVLLLHPG